MDIEISHPYTKARMAGGYVWNSDKYENLPHSNWIGWVRDVMKDKRLFLYRHKRKNGYVLAAWLYRPGEWGEGVFVPLRGMTNHPDNYGGQQRPNIHQLHALCGRVETAVSGIRKSLVDERYEEKAAADETEQSKKDLASYYRKCGLEGDAMLIERGVIPHMSRREGGEAFDQIEEAFK